MKLQNLIRSLPFAALAGLVLAAAPARAGTMSAGPTASPVDGEDIANFGTGNGTDKWWPSSAPAFGNPGMTIGQPLVNDPRDKGGKCGACICKPGQRAAQTK